MLLKQMYSKLFSVTTLPIGQDKLDEEEIVELF